MSGLLLQHKQSSLCDNYQNSPMPQKMKSEIFPHLDALTRNNDSIAKIPKFATYGTSLELDICELVRLVQRLTHGLETRAFSTVWQTPCHKNHTEIVISYILQQSSHLNHIHIFDYLTSHTISRRHQSTKAQL